MAELARVRTVITGWPGAPGLSTNYFVDSSPLGWSNLVDAIREQIKLSWDSLAPYIHTNVTATVEKPVDIIEDTTGEILQTVAGDEVYSVTGTSTDPFLPPATAMAVTWRTDGVVAGKHVRGRTYLSPLTNVASSPYGVPSSTFIEDAEAYALEMNDGSANYPLAIWSRPKTGAGAREGSTHLVTSSVVGTEFAVLRSRRD